MADKMEPKSWKELNLYQKHVLLCLEDIATHTGETAHAIDCMWSSFTTLLNRLDDIDAHLANLDTLAKCQRQNRDRQERFRFRNKHHNVTDNVTKESEREDGKEKRETSPHTPYKREKGKGEGKEKETQKKQTRVRAGVSEIFFFPTAEEVGEYWKLRDYESDCNHFFNLNNARGWKHGDTAIANWKSLADNFEKKYQLKNAGKTRKTTKPKPPRTFTTADWILCAERCAAFKDGKCTRGYTTPPDRDESHPHPPSECPKFKSK